MLLGENQNNNNNKKITNYGDGRGDGDGDRLANKHFSLSRGKRVKSRAHWLAGWLT